MRKGKNRENEKGAAMVMVLLLSTLLLVASGGLLLEVTFNTANVTDSTAEQQAYNAAESGLQSAINVLRGNVVLADAYRYDATKPATAPANRIDFRKAVTAAKSNLPTDTSGIARLSRWMNYNFTSSGSSYADRSTLNTDAYAYSLEVVDPDNTGNIISFTTTGGLYDPNPAATTKWKSDLTIGSGGDTLRIRYEPAAVTNLDVSSGSANTSYGHFRIEKNGLGASLPLEGVRFQIVVNMKAPYTATKVLRGYLKAPLLATPTLYQFDFDSQVNTIMGSTITLDNDIFLAAANTTLNVGANVTQAEPYRVVVRSTGYGPRGAKKVLEATVQKNFFNGMSAPATLTLVGSSDGFVFNAGESQNVTYSGDDVASTVLIPPIGTTNDGNLGSVFGTLDGRSRKADVIGEPANVDVEMPFWLQSPANLDRTIQDLKAVAASSGRYYANGVQPPNFGNNATATGITFADGDIDLSGDGGGILVCTGKLTLRGAFNFNGLIIVTGPGGVDRSGGGNGVLQGNIVIAPYNKNNLSAPFLAPKYDISGGGTSEITYNSSSIANGMTAVSNFVLGVAEK